MLFMLYLQFKAAMTDILVAHHLSIIADLEPMKATKHRADAFAAVDHAIAVFEKVGRKFCHTILNGGDFITNYRDTPFRLSGLVLEFCKISSACLI